MLVMFAPPPIKRVQRAEYTQHLTDSSISTKVLSIDHILFVFPFIFLCYFEPFFFLFVRLLLRKCLKVICPCENQTWYKKFWFKKCINLIWCWKRVHVLTCLAYLHFLLYLFIHTLITIDSISWLKSTIKLYSSKLINVN